MPSEFTRRRLLPWLLLLFFGSGCAALIYEIVWLQLLELVIGASGISLGVLLGTFMGGMCLGSLLLPRLLSPHHHPLRIYAFLELAIGVIAIDSLFSPVGRVRYAGLGEVNPVGSGSVVAGVAGYEVGTLEPVTALEVLISAQADNTGIEARAAPPITIPAFFRNSLLEIFCDAPYSLSEWFMLCSPLSTSMNH